MPTIVPITPESVWQSTLSGLPLWTPPTVPTVVLAPHPDDEALGAGGLIQRLRSHEIPVTVVAVTDGEGAYADNSNLAAIRIPEHEESLRRLGVSPAMIHRLHLPDSGVAANEDRLVDLLGPLMSAGTHIVAPWQYDFHPDHEATGRAAERIACAMGLSVSFYLFWAWHRGTPDLLGELNPTMFPLANSEVAAKLHAIEAHVSQLEHPDGQPILSAELLAPARRNFEVYIR